ncbi:hypothetical protein [Acidithrix sp. C25]|uniref:hypothetical protein n=1 Tax=Acidithrix sp. C25 TaxID=1671482 RepID=UPI00191BBF96|nr:hypothetical protein [Acidithrix sp. C25]
MSKSAPYVAPQKHHYWSITYLEDVANEGFILPDPTSALRPIPDARPDQADVRCCCHPAQRLGGDLGNRSRECSFDS